MTEEAEMLPVTQADKDLYRVLLNIAHENLERRRRGEPIVDALQLLARHRRATLSEAKLPEGDAVEREIGGDLPIRALNLARCLAQAEFRSEVDRCIDEAQAIVAALSVSPSRVDGMVEALKQIADMPYAGAPDIRMREIARAALRAHVGEGKKE